MEDQGNEKVITEQPQQGQGGGNAGATTPQQQVKIPGPGPLLIPGVPHGLELLHQVQQQELTVEPEGFGNSQFGIVDGQGNRLFSAVLDLNRCCCGCCCECCSAGINLSFINHLGQPVADGIGSFGCCKKFITIGQGPDIFGRVYCYRSCFTARFKFVLENAAGNRFLKIQPPLCCGDCDCCCGCCCGCCRKYDVYTQGPGCCSCSKGVSKIYWKRLGCCCNCCSIKFRFRFTFPPGLDTKMKMVFIAAIFLINVQKRMRARPQRNTAGGILGLAKTATNLYLKFGNPVPFSI